MTRVAIDPITRIEGHLRIEVEVQNGVVTDAWSTGTMFRGIESILKGRDPRDAWVFAQRACGVCTTVHALASVRAVENALGLRIPKNARLVRNLIAGIQFVQDHVIHFYHLHALDWVDILSAQTADPAKAAALQRSISTWPNNTAAYFKGVQDRIRTFVGSGQLGLFANGYWGHTAYRLPPEANLMAVAHYLEALDWQRDVIRIQAFLGGKNPHPQTYVVGGTALAIDPNSEAAFNAQRFADVAALVARAKDFVDRVYMPDVTAVAGFYPEWARLGKGIGNYLAYGEFPDSDSGAPAALYLPRGRVMARDLSKTLPVDQASVTETVAHAWYDDAGGGMARHPYDGDTSPRYTGPTPPFTIVSDNTRYSWLKAPRLDGQPMEVGPLARMLVAYASGHREVKPAIDGMLGRLGLPASSLFSTLGRVAARAIETQVVANQLGRWLSELEANARGGDLAIADVSKWDPARWPATARGFGMSEAPRGALGHWVVIQNRAIARYQMVVPSTWNGSPRDAAGRRGAWEEALVGTPIVDAARPVEVLRTVHSFDPCMACAVHVYDPAAGSDVEIRVV